MQWERSQRHNARTEIPLDTCSLLDFSSVRVHAVNEPLITVLYRYIEPGLLSSVAFYFL